jgi:hypothetical protein
MLLDNYNQVRLVTSQSGPFSSEASTLVYQLLDNYNQVRLVTSQSGPFS